MIVFRGQISLSFRFTSSRVPNIIVFILFLSMDICHFIGLKVELTRGRYLHE